MKAYVKEALILTSRKLYEVRIVREKGVDLDTSYDEYTFGVYEDTNTAIAVAEGLNNGLLIPRPMPSPIIPTTPPMPPYEQMLQRLDIIIGLLKTISEATYPMGQDPYPYPTTPLSPYTSTSSHDIGDGK